jgi:hypothetical protein
MRNAESGKEKENLVCRHPADAASHGTITKTNFGNPEMLRSLLRRAPASSYTSFTMADSSSTIVDRVQNFVSEHKKAILITTAAAAIGAAGVAYYASTSRPRPPPDVEQAGEKKDKKKSKGKKKKSTKGDSGPILEERKPKVEAASGKR